MSIRRVLRIFTPGPWRYRAQRASEVIRGVDFMRIIEAHEVGLDPALAVHSSPSGNRYLIRALEAMSITPADRILDIGCGKGSAMSVMLKLPFAAVDGVELSEEIASIARANFVALGVPAERCKVRAADATALRTELDGYSHFYMYNPFRSPIMKRVAANLSESLDRHPRSVSLLYNTPACRADIDATGRFEVVRSFEGVDGAEMLWYRSRA